MSAEQNAKYAEERTKTFAESASALQKQLDVLTDERDQLQIGIAEATANLTAGNRKFATLKQRYQTLSEEFNALQAEHQRDIKTVPPLLLVSSPLFSLRLSSFFSSPLPAR